MDRAASHGIPLPPQEFMEAVTGWSPTAEEYQQTGRSIRNWIARVCKTKPTDAILDIGSGCGRVAAHFVDDHVGVYRGIDIVKPAVDWCNAEISSRYPNFHFHHADLSNTKYPGGAADAADFSFPFHDRTFDVVFATSVFTHLVPGSARNYMREIGRILRPGGRACLTFFLTTDEWRARFANGEHLIPHLAYEFQGCRVIDPADPEHVIAYDKNDAVGMIIAAGLRVDDIALGSLSMARDECIQDNILVSKP